MKIQNRFLLLALVVSASGCSADPSLQAAFEKKMKDDGAAGFEIIHIEENPGDGFVVYDSWTEQYPENRDLPGLLYFEKPDGAWQNTTGTECSERGLSKLSLMGNGYIFCSILRPDRDFEKIRVGGAEAKILAFGDGRQVWYALTNDWEAKVVGVTGDGKEFGLN